MLNILAPNQFSFCEKYSTIMTLLTLVDRNSGRIDNKDYSSSIFMGLSEAFNRPTTNHDILLGKLELYGVHCVALNGSRAI
jgi:hypothetical protein